MYEVLQLITDGNPNKEKEKKRYVEKRSQWTPAKQQ
jgi:hypothetical protein